MQGAVSFILVLLLLASPAFSATNNLDAALFTDSDHDGATDWQEWLAGTNPDDPSNVFEITSSRLQNGGLVISWNSISSSDYVLVTADSPSALSTNTRTAAIVAPHGGIAPWYQVPASITNHAGTNAVFFRIELKPKQVFEEAVFDMTTFE
ncbi:MAG TPA: hypothetical protein PLE77_10745 [Kiritimatiellia bacterium]|nr:hypothetical protein [Kiritimatiellia bacterium]